MMPPTRSAHARTNRRAAAEGLDRLLAAGSLDALNALTLSPAWKSDLVNGDHVLGGATTLPAVAGYPHITVPMGQVQGLPVGLSFMGPAWSDAKLLGIAFAYEQRTQLRRPPPLDQRSVLAIRAYLGAGWHRTSHRCAFKAA
jgi:amidase